MDADEPAQETPAASRGSGRLRVVAWLGRRLQELLAELERVGFLPVGAEAHPVHTLSVNPECTAVLDHLGQNPLRSVGQGDPISHTELGACLLALLIWLLPSPQRGPGQGFLPPAHHFVESPRQSPAGTPPTPHLRKSKGRRPAEPGRVKVLVRDRIAPVIEVLEVAPSLSITEEGADP
jgi:hypothetical protein